MVFKFESVLLILFSCLRKTMRDSQNLDEVTADRRPQTFKDN